MARRPPWLRVKRRRRLGSGHGRPPPTTSLTLKSRVAVHGTPADEHDSCRVGSLAVSEPVTVRRDLGGRPLLLQRRQQPGRRHRLRRLRAAARCARRPAWCSTRSARTGPQTIREMLGHLGGCRFFAADGGELPPAAVLEHLDGFRLPVRDAYAGEDGLAARRPARGPGRLPPLLRRHPAPGPGALRAPPHRQPALAAAARPSTPTCADGARALGGGAEADRPSEPAPPPSAPSTPRAARRFLQDVREEYFTVLAHLLDSRYYRTHGEPAADERPARRAAGASTPPSAAATWSRWARTWPP